jgi:hypothetical protein
VLIVLISLAHHPQGRRQILTVVIVSFSLGSRCRWCPTSLCVFNLLANPLAAPVSSIRWLCRFCCPSRAAIVSVGHHEVGTTFFLMSTTASRRVVLKR